MQNGWIKLYRKLKDKGFYKKPYYLALWVHLLLSANHQESEFLWNGKLVKVKEGQFITGRKELSTQTGIPQTTIERILQTLENGHQIGQQKTSKFRLITILKWKSYQNTDRKTDNKRTTSGHKQEGKEEKEIYNYKKEEKPKIDIEKFRPEFIRKPTYHEKKQKIL